MKWRLIATTLVMFASGTAYGEEPSAEGARTFIAEVLNRGGPTSLSVPTVRRRPTIGTQLPARNPIRARR